MSLDKVRAYLKEQGIEDRLKVFEASSATVEEAALAVGCEPAHIAKSMSFLLKKENPILVVTAGDQKIDNKKYKERFGEKPKMIHWEEVEGYIGHAPGGVCPFATKENIPVYLDESLKRFTYVYPAGGDDHSAVELTPEELYQYAGASEWVDVCVVRA